MIRGFTLVVALLAATGAAALDLPSNARLTAERVTDNDRYNAPVAPFDGSRIPVQAVDGRIVRQAWRIPGVNLTPLQVLAPLRAQLEADGYAVVLDCMDDRCGGFDFRFGTEILPAPAMFVNLQEFHVLTMRKGPAEKLETMVSLLASASANVAHLQIIEATATGHTTGSVRTATIDRPEPTPQPEPEQPTAGSVTEGLAALGFHVLHDLDFETGATELGPGPFPDLEELASYLTENPDLRIALVGHTDTVGALDSNIAISRARARSVRQRLIDAYGIAPERLDAEGMGYLAPRASNLTADGREANRRVEVVILNANTNPKEE